MEPRLSCPLIFVHMFKAGGTSLRRVIRKQFHEAKVCLLNGNFAESNAWRALPQEERDTFDLVIGHQHYGHHEFLSQRASYMTMLREPVDRVLSFYFYVKRFKDHYLYNHGFTDETALEEFVENERFIALDNIQTRLLNQQPVKHHPFGSVDEEMFAVALANLERIERVGVVERMDEFLEVLRVAEGWTIPEAPVKNRTDNRPKVGDQPEAVLERIRELNQFDIRLHEAACARFERDWAQCLSATSPGEV